MSDEYQRSAVVTGAASGLGRATATALRHRGFTVAGLDVSECGDLEHHAVVDITNRSDLEEATASVVGTLGGRLDAVVNAAGTVFDAVTPVGDLDDDVVESTLAVNLLGALNVVRATLPALSSGGGSLVLVASCVARSPQAGASAYAMAKAGVVSLARSVAVEYASRGVRANTVSPGFMDTAMAAPVLSVPARRARVEASIPRGTVADPREVASLIAWLASDESVAMTGEDVLIDGGQVHTAYTTTADTQRLWDSRESPRRERQT